jgi:hypothetical protein
MSNDEDMIATPGGGGFIPPLWASEMYRDLMEQAMRTTLGLPPDTRTPEQRKIDRADYERRRIEHHAAISTAHDALIAEATGLRRAVLELHGPGREPYGWEPRCDGCESEGYESEQPTFPCSTYVLARDFRGPSPLAELQDRYLEVRRHTLSTAGLTGDLRLLAQAHYVRDEADELVDAVEDLFAPANVDVMECVRHEIADVVLAAVTLANIVGVTVEACIVEKTEADRGRG